MLSVDSNVSSIPDTQAEYALRLLEKGYSISQLCQIIGVPRDVLLEALDAARARRV